MQRIRDDYIANSREGNKQGIQLVNYSKKYENYIKSI